MKSLLLCVLSVCCSAQALGGAAFPWAYPGIPYTDWNYNPFTVQPQAPSEWPSAAASDRYYIEPNHPAASDTAQGGEPTGPYGRFGYPDRSRATLPSGGWISDEFTPGTLIWIKGGVFTAGNFYPVWAPRLQGSEAQPVWLYGDPTQPPVFSGVRFSLYDSRHAILDNLHWIGGNTSNNVLSLTRDRPGPTHHITLRNLRFENLNWIAGGGAVVSLSASNQNGAELHDVVAYNNVFKNNGGGYDWSTQDNDHHGYKINGLIDGNAARRVWIIDNQALGGDLPDPVDGRIKSLSGDLVQVGDQNATSGNNHHIFVAGNYAEHMRQSLGWTKRSHDVIFSSNHCHENYALAGTNGQCFGHQYDLGDYNWWIANVATGAASGWMHTANDPMSGPLFIVGNVFYNNRKGEADDNWRLCSGVTLFNQRGVHYFVNNVFDDQCHGVWARTNRHSPGDQLHLYNNVFSNTSGTIDSTARAVTLEDTNGLALFVENNLFDAFSGAVSLNGTVLNTLADLNAAGWAQHNILGDPGYLDLSQRNYDLGATSDAIDAGTAGGQSGTHDVYQMFVSRYSNDADYPGDPAQHWPRDFLNRARIQAAGIDIGAHERAADDLIYRHGFEAPARND